METVEKIGLTDRFTSVLRQLDMVACPGIEQTEAFVDSGVVLVPVQIAVFDKLSMLLFSSMTSNLIQDPRRLNSAEFVEVYKPSISKQIKAQSAKFGKLAEEYIYLQTDLKLLLWQKRESGK